MKEKKVDANRVCAIDPGISTFMTCVSTDIAVKYEDRFLKKLFKKHDGLKKNVSSLSKYNKNRKNTYRAYPLGKKRYFHNL